MGYQSLTWVNLFDPPHEKTINVVSEQVVYKPSCTSTADGYRLEILDSESRATVLFV